MRLPSVTTVLAPYQDFSGVPASVLLAAADRGSRVHAICAAISRKLFVPAVPEDCAPYVASFKGWFGTAVAKTVAVELEYSCDLYGYMGHPDGIYLLKGDDGLTLVDIKTPQAAVRIWKMQLAAYWHLAEKAGLDVRRALCLRLDKDGKRPRIDELNDRANAWAAFLGALNAWKYLKAA